MNTPPKVSFLIPARNRPRELKAALASCITQSLEAWEAVVVDDHSDSADLAALVTTLNDSRLRYYRLKPGEGGVAEARNRAVAMAKRAIAAPRHLLLHPRCPLQR